MTEKIWVFIVAPFCYFNMHTSDSLLYFIVSEFQSFVIKKCLRYKGIQVYGIKYSPIPCTSIPFDIINQFVKLCSLDGVDFTLPPSPNFSRIL